MSDLFPFLIAGLVAGSLYGVTAMGLVLTYRTSGIFNFGHGAIAAGAAYLFYELRTLRGLPWPVAASLCIFVAAPVLGGVLELTARGLAASTLAAKIVGTVGIFLAIQGLLTFRYGSSTITFEPFLPQRVFEVAGVRVGADQVIVMTIGAVLAVGLSAFLRYTRLGIAMRGMVDDPALLDLTGASHTVIRLASWIIGSCFAALSGLLIAPTIGLDPLLLTMLVVQAFGAAVIGRLSSLPLTYAGGLVVGVLASVLTKYVSGHAAFGGLPASVPFIVLFGVLLTSRKGRLSEAGTVPVGRVRRQAPAAVIIGLVVLVAVGLVAVPGIVGTRLSVYTNALIFVLVFLSLRLLVRSSGQVSLCHAAFAAIGAAAFSHLSHGLGLPWPVAVAGAGLAAVPVGAVVAVPAIRLSGLYLALATFGFGILVERLGFTTALMFGKVGARVAPRPQGRLFGVDLAGDRGFYYVVLVVVVVGILAVAVIDRTRLGRLLQGLAGSPVALTTQGATVNITRVLVFAVSAALAGVAGALFGSLSGSINGTPFNSLQSLLWLAVLAIAGSGRFSAAFVAAGLLAVLPSYFTNPRWVELLPVAFGLAALGSSVLQDATPAVADCLRRSTFRRRELDRPGPAEERWRASSPSVVVLPGAVAS
jgi:branched-subunit amino acid ABC-type transport system permease component